MHTMITNDSAITDDVVKNIGDVALDSISGIEKIKLNKEAGSLRSNLQEAQAGMEKLKMVRRIKEIRDALGVVNTTEPEVIQQHHCRCERLNAAIKTVHGQGSVIGNRHGYSWRGRPIF